MRHTRTKREVRLPAHFTPERYTLTFAPDLARGVFSGEEVISYVLSKPTKEITLHAEELEIRCEAAQSVSYDKKSETVTLRFPKPLPKGRGKLSLSFTGVLNDRMRGFYRSRYSVGTQEHYLATTQFEATDARRAFPCVDEPAAKAVFDVTLRIPKGHQAISNTYATVVREHAGYEVVEFAPSPKMSTYLLAFIVGKFETIERKTKHGTVVRVSVTPGKKHQAAFALDTAAKVLEFYEEYFAIRFPLPTLDMIAIPDFAVGAMENWGAITYRETALLYDTEQSSAAGKQRVALVIAHEIAHQWFGNLVTMEWWTHLWLNEGFASYIEYLAVDHLFPKWDMWTQFVVSDLTPALKLDALANTHAIEIEVHHPSEINEIFDAVSYSKGASIIRMLADYLGEKDFRNGLRRYLKKHQYGNAVTEDLWRSLEAVSKKPVRRLMSGWTAQPGYPVVKVVKKPRGLQLSQSRFYMSARVRKAQRDDAKWMVPITYRREGSREKKRLFLDKRSERIAVKLEEGEWLKLNTGSAGVYRVDYPSDILARLTELVEKKALPAIDRFSIQNDAYALARSGELPTPSFLTLAPSYAGETDYSVWQDLSDNLHAIGFLLKDEPCHEAYREFAKGIFARLAKAYGWKKRPKEAHTDSLLRALALLEYGSYGDEDTCRRARKLFAAFMKGKSIDPDLRSVVYLLAAKNGGTREYDFFIKRYRMETLPEEKNRLGAALGKFRSKALLRKTLAFSISKDVRVQDTLGIVTSVLGNPEGTELAWQFAKKHWALFVDRYGTSVYALSRFVLGLSAFASEAKARELKVFFKTNRAPAAERAVLQVLETIYANADWLKRDRKRIAAWLEKT